MRSERKGTRRDIRHALPGRRGAHEISGKEEQDVGERPRHPPKGDSEAPDADKSVL